MISIIMLFVDLPILDPILSIVIAIFVLSRIVPTFAKIGRVFLQYKPGDIELEDIEQECASINMVDNVHDIHLWSLDGTHHIASLHAVVEKNCSIKDLIQIKSFIKEKLKKMGISHKTVEFEFGEDDCI